MKEDNVLWERFLEYVIDCKAGGLRLFWSRSLSIENPSLLRSKLANFGLTGRKGIATKLATLANTGTRPEKALPGTLVV